MRTSGVMAGTGHCTPISVRFIYPKGSPTMEFFSIIIDTLLSITKGLGGGLHGLNSLLGDFLSSSDTPVVPEPEEPTSIPLVPLEPATPIVDVDVEV